MRERRDRGFVPQAIWGKGVSYPKGHIWKVVGIVGPVMEERRRRSVYSYNEIAGGQLPWGLTVEELVGAGGSCVGGMASGGGIFVVGALLDLINPLASAGIGASICGTHTRLPNSGPCRMNEKRRSNSDKEDVSSRESNEIIHLHG